MMVAYVVLLSTATLGFAVFTVRYHVFSAWRVSAVGRNLMAFMSLCWLLLSLAIVRLIIGDLPGWLRVGSFAMLNVVVWWRVALLIQAQRGAHTQHAVPAQRDVSGNDA